MNKAARWRNRNPTYMLWRSAKKRASRKGLEFDLTIADLGTMPETCPILGIPMFRNKKVPCDNSPTLDRIDPERGYTKENICIISHRANRLKSDMSLKELELILSYVRGHRPSLDPYYGNKNGGSLKRV